MSIFKSICTALLLFSSYAALSQPAKDSLQAIKLLQEEMIRFFQGKWHGKGQFASGKAIEADIDFKLLLDDKWLQSEHIDMAPNKYRSVSMWGWDKNESKMVAYVFDNFSGHRKFTSEGWVDGKLVLIYQDGKLFQRFTYEKQSATAFKMSYEVSNDGKEWRVIDWLLFERS